MNQVTLGFFKGSARNVGDDLNLWLWPKLLSNISFSDSADMVFIGIGSILDHRFDSYKQKIVVGAGARSIGTLPLLDESWNIVFIRGPKTQAAFAEQGQSVKYITDPAIFIGDYYTQIDNPCDVGLIPYYKSDHDCWSLLAQRLGYRLISPKSEVEEFCQAISECQYVITEAMHGAIFADSIRVPWFPVSSSTVFHENETHEFKWRDWTESMGLQFSEKIIPQAWPNDGRMKRWIKLQKMQFNIKSISIKDCFLSDDEIFHSRLEEMRDVLDQLQVSLK